VVFGEGGGAAGFRWSWGFGVVGVVTGVAYFGVVVLEWWSSVPVTDVAVGGCVCGCGRWSGIVVGVVGIGNDGVVGGRGVVVGGGDVAVGVTVVVGRRWGGGGAVRMVVDVVAGGGLVCGVGGGVVVGVSSVLRDFQLP
jgi:hypothetical protein